MPAWRVRDFQDDDLDQAIQVWDESRAGLESVFSVTISSTRPTLTT